MALFTSSLCATGRVSLRFLVHASTVAEQSSCCTAAAVSLVLVCRHGTTASMCMRRGQSRRLSLTDIKMGCSISTSFGPSSSQRLLYKCT